MRSDLVLKYPARALRSRVHVAPDGLDSLGRFTASLTRASRVAVVSDLRVAALYGERALRSLKRARIEAELITLPAGERTKQPRQIAKLWDVFAALELSRSDAVIALGGGVIGDVAGFAAASWLRGVDWVGVPTTVVAQVDSSIGGKTGIDVVAGKNLVGAFHQPIGVLVDPTTLQTLPARHRRAGLAEVVKTGMVCDAKLFEWIESRIPDLAKGDPDALHGAVARSIRVKAAVVQRDERESGPRTALNFGHTTGHAIEAALGYRRLLHGEAVAVGMRVAAGLSRREVGLSQRAHDRLVALLDALRLPQRMPPLALEDILSAMKQDKKRARGGVRWVLTPRVGHASVPRLITGRLVRTALIEAGATA